jgi:hypothetical protein
MKDVKVDVKKGGAGCSFWLFSTIEALHLWIEDAKADVTVLPQFLAQGYARHFAFCEGETFDVKWLGCDVIYTDDKLHVYNNVCIHAVQQTMHSPIHRMFKGYISKEIMPLEAFDGDNISIVEVETNAQNEVEITAHELEHAAMTQDLDASTLLK